MVRLRYVAMHFKGWIKKTRYRLYEGEAHARGGEGALSKMIQRDQFIHVCCRMRECPRDGRRFRWDVCYLANAGGQQICTRPIAFSKVHFSHETVSGLL